MGNVVSMARSCEFWVRRAAARRRAGNYDEAMTLLSKAKEQFGLREDIEIELARAYDEMQCEEEASRAYLRVVRLGGAHKAEALFQLALSSAQRADLDRAVSYFEQLSAGELNGVPEEYVRMLGQQLREELERPVSLTRKGRAHALMLRGVERMQEGKTAAARRALSHALALCETAKTHTLLTCCALLEGDGPAAVDHALSANRIAPGRVQTLLVLADAYALCGDAQAARRALFLAAMRARDTDDWLAVALESAKRAEDTLTLHLTRKLLRLEPFNTRAMLLQACALTNQGRLRQASRLFGRLCVLLPENTVCESFYRLTRDGLLPDEPIALGMEVTRKEGVTRAVQLVSALYTPREDLLAEPGQERTLCRLAAWSFRSVLAGEQVATVALLVMGMLNTPAAREVLYDALTDPQVDDAFKCRVLQLLTGQEGIKPYPVDIGGRLVHLAAGGTAQQGAGSELSRLIVQRASDELSPAFPDAPGVLLPVWLAYLDRYGVPRRRDASACAAALEFIYHIRRGRQVDLHAIAKKSFVSPRLCRFFVRRLLRAAQSQTPPEHPDSAHGDGETTF